MSGPHLGHTQRTALSRPVSRLQSKQEKELRETDKRHIHQRHEVIKREKLNKEVIKRLKAREHKRQDDRGRTREP